MSLYYTHLLIPESDTLCPESSDVTRFLDHVREAGFVTSEMKVIFQRVEAHPPETKKFENPVTGAVLNVPMPTYRVAELLEFQSLPEAARMLHENSNCSLGLSCFGYPSKWSVRVGVIDDQGWHEFTGPYALTIRCCIRSLPVSMSDLHEESRSKIKAFPFGEPGGPRSRFAYYSHPDTLEVITVSGTANARFWIEVAYGKMLFAQIVNGNLATANKKLLTLAADAFKIEFQQGCQWG